MCTYKIIVKMRNEKNSKIARGAFYNTTNRNASTEDGTRSEFRCKNMLCPYSIISQFRGDIVEYE